MVLVEGGGGGGVGGRGGGQFRGNRSLNMFDHVSFSAQSRVLASILLFAVLNDLFVLMLSLADSSCRSIPMFTYFCTR